MSPPTIHKREVSNIIGLPGIDPPTELSQTFLKPNGGAVGGAVPTRATSQQGTHSCSKQPATRQRINMMINGKVIGSIATSDPEPVRRMHEGHRRRRRPRVAVVSQWDERPWLPSRDSI